MSKHPAMTTGSMDQSAVTTDSAAYRKLGLHSASPNINQSPLAGLAGKGEIESNIPKHSLVDSGVAVDIPGSRSALCVSTETVTEESTGKENKHSISIEKKLHANGPYVRVYEKSTNEGATFSPLVGSPSSVGREVESLKYTSIIDVSSNREKLWSPNDYPTMYHFTNAASRHQLTSPESPLICQIVIATGLLL
jgi:hypothetical protein